MLKLKRLRGGIFLKYFRYSAVNVRKLAQTFAVNVRFVFSVGKGGFPCIKVSSLHQFYYKSPPRVSSIHEGVHAKEALTINGFILYDT